MNHENIKVRNEQILNDYVAGMSVEAISEKYQLSSYHCYSILRQLDYRKYERTAVKSRSPFPDRNRQIIDEYRNGVSATELTKKYNLSRARVYKILSHSVEYTFKQDGLYLRDGELWVNPSAEPFFSIQDALDFIPLENICGVLLPSGEVYL